MNAQQLKDSILQYAIKGMLVRPDPEDEDVTLLMKKIRSEKNRLINEKIIKREKPLLPISAEEIPFDIPEHWEWVRLKDIAHYIKAGGDKPKEFSVEKTITNSIPVIANGKKNKGVVGYTNEAKAEAKTITISGRGTIGYAEIREEPYVPIVRLIVLKLDKAVSSEFIKYVLESLLERGLGTSIPQLTVPMIETKLIPLPPFNEQLRIVREINQLLKLVNDYEIVYELYEASQREFPRKLENSILHYAMQGKLVEQDPSDEPAVELIKQINEEKKRLIEEKIIKKEKPLPPIGNEEIPFDIPKSWEWIRLGDICQIEMGQSPTGNSVMIGDKGIEFHQGKSHFGKLFLKSSSQITTEPRKIASKNSIVMSVRAPVGDVNITQRSICIGRGLASIRPIMNVKLKYLYYFLLIKKKDFERVATGSTFKAINKSIVTNTLVPLPPLNEQKRIVSKIEDSFQILKQLN